MNISIPPAWGVRCGPWRVASASSIGAHHEYCEDASLAHFPETGGLHLSVSDGVSGGDVGHVAAQTLVHHCVSLPNTAVLDIEAVAQWVEASDAIVADAVIACGCQRGAACMASVWLNANGDGCLSHVGDCRIYGWRITGEGITVVTALTIDQTYAHMGESPPRGVRAGNPARMAGSGSVGRAQVRKFFSGDYNGLLLCSDGVHAALQSTDLAALIGAEIGDRTVGDGDLERISQSIVRQSAIQGSTDDICVAIVWRQ